MGLRVAHVGVLAVTSTALLLLLSRYGAEEAPHRPRRPLLVPPAFAEALLNATVRLNSTAPAATHTLPTSTSANTTNATTSTTTSTAKPTQDARILMTRNMYEAGHSRPHPELCPALGQNLKLMIFVTSAPSHLQARQAIRLTWGHFAARTDVGLAFFLGLAPATLQAELDAEDAMYGDVVRGNFVDSYSNLTLKTISMLEWADSYCPKANKILKTDDDMFINVPRLIAFIEKRLTVKKTIWGKVYKKNFPKRSPKSKYYVSPLQYSGRVYPDFASGPAYLLTSDVVSELYASALSQPYVRLEDVFLTGILASQLHIKRVSTPEFYNKKVSLHPCVVQRGIAIHMVRYHEQFDLWRKLLDGQSKCSGR